MLDNRYVVFVMLGYMRCYAFEMNQETNGLMELDDLPIEHKKTVMKLLRVASFTINSQ